MDRIRRRSLIATILALCLAVASVSAVAAVAGGVITARHSAAHALPAATPAGDVLAEAGNADHGWAVDSAAAAAPASFAPADPPDYAKPKPRTVAPQPSAPAVAKATPKAAPKATPKPTTKAVVKAPAVKPKSAPKAVVYSGRNHVWIPSLGINRSVSFFPCDRAAPPDNLVYRWGCAPRPTTSCTAGAVPAPTTST
jgi:outer membrane biosynthesis protein TonB